MAKVSSVERNLKRQRMVAKYAAKRALLKDIARNKELPVEELSLIHISEPTRPY